MAPGLDKNDYVDRGATTRAWLVDRMNANPRGMESLYPDFGHAAGVPAAQRDRTVTVRQDYPARGPDSARVAVLTTIDGTHQVPGARGDSPPCGGVVQQAASVVGAPPSCH